MVNEESANTQVESNGTDAPPPREFVAINVSVTGEAEIRVRMRVGAPFWKLARLISTNFHMPFGVVLLLNGRKIEDGDTVESLGINDDARIISNAVDPGRIFD